MSPCGSISAPDLCLAASICPPPNAAQVCLTPSLRSDAHGPLGDPRPSLSVARMPPSRLSVRAQPRDVFAFAGSVRTCPPSEFPRAGEIGERLVDRLRDAPPLRDVSSCVRSCDSAAHHPPAKMLYTAGASPGYQLRVGVSHPAGQLVKIIISQVCWLVLRSRRTRPRKPLFQRFQGDRHPRAHVLRLSDTGRRAPPLYDWSWTARRLNVRGSGVEYGELTEHCSDGHHDRPQYSPSRPGENCGRS